MIFSKPLLGKKYIPPKKRQKQCIPKDRAEELRILAEYMASGKATIIAPHVPPESFPVTPRELDAASIDEIPLSDRNTF